MAGGGGLEGETEDLLLNKKQNTSEALVNLSQKLSHLGVLEEVRQCPGVRWRAGLETQAQL